MSKQATLPSNPTPPQTYRSKIGRRLANLDGGRRVSDRAHRAGHRRGSQGSGTGVGQSRGGHEGATEQSAAGEAVKHHDGAAVVRCVWWSGVYVGLQGRVLVLLF
jgi:hypothetical protein